MNKRMPSIDIFKYLASIFVIALHTRPLVQVSRIADFIFTQGICRVAVPFFLVCTGFFVGARLKDYYENNASVKEVRKTILKSPLKLFLLYLSCSLLFLLISIPAWISTGWFSYKAFIDWAIAFFTIGSYYHLWYLGAACLATLVLSLVFPIINKKSIIPIILILWIFGILDYSYGWILPDLLKQLLSYLGKLSLLTSGVFRALPLILLGVYIQMIKEFPIKIYIIGLILSCILMVFEIVILYSKGVESFGYIFSTLPCAFFLFNIIHYFDGIISKKNTLILAQMSTFNYCIHPAIISLVTCINVSSNWLVFILVVIFVNALGLCFYKIKGNL